MIQILAKEMGEEVFPVPLSFQKGPKMQGAGGRSPFVAEFCCVWKSYPALRQPSCSMSTGKRRKTKIKLRLPDTLWGTLYGRKTMKAETYLAPCSPVSWFPFLARSISVMHTVSLPQYCISSCLKNENNSSMVRFN